MSISLKADPSGAFGSILINGNEAVRVNPTGIPATSTTFTPSGTVAASNVQAAIQELDTEKAEKAAPIYQGTIAAFTNTIAGSTEAVVPTPNKQDRINQSGVDITPLVPGWYQVSMSALCTGATAAMGVVLVTGGTVAQIQPPYSTNLAYASVSQMLYFDGSTSMRFGVFGANAGCSFSNIRCSIVLVREGL